MNVKAEPLRADEETGAFHGAPSFSFRHRVIRVVWNCVWLTLAAWTPAPLHRWRIFLVRLFGGRVAYNAFLYGSTKIWYPPNLTMHEHATLGPKVNCYCLAHVKIGPYAIVSQGAHLCTGTHDFHRASFQIYGKPIEIGADAWVCTEAFVGPGIVVGDGAVLGARAVTFNELAPWTVYSGNPALKKSDRTRFQR